MKLSLSICFFYTVGLLFSKSKQDFNNYKTLISRGEIHNNLSFSTSEKIQIKLDNLRKMMKK